jgi:hypothetical protein
MMLTLIEGIAITLLSLGLIKNIIGFISPKHLKDLSSKMLLQWSGHSKKLWVGFMAIFSVALIYASYITGLSLAEWIVAGYSAILLFFVLFLSFGDTMRDLTKSILKLPDDQLRKLNVVAIILLGLGLYFLLV